MKILSRLISRTIIRDNRIDIRTICESGSWVARDGQHPFQHFRVVVVVVVVDGEKGGGRQGEAESDIGNTDDAPFQMVSPVTNSWRYGPRWGGVFSAIPVHNPWDEHFLNHGKCPRNASSRRRPTLSFYPLLSPVSRISLDARTVYSEMQRRA